MSVALHSEAKSGRLSGHGFVLHHLNECAGVDVIEVSEDVHMPWCPCMGSNKLGVQPQRLLVILNANAVSLVQFGDVGAVLVSICVDEAVGCVACRTAMRVVNDYDILYTEQMLSDGDGAQRINSAPSGNDNGEHGRG